MVIVTYNLKMQYQLFSYPVLMHLMYLAISITLTVWVGRTLHRNGRVFIVDACGGKQQLADSINHLLLVGFYLINLGFIALYLTHGKDPTNVVTLIRALSYQIGVVLLVLGGMHFLNLYVFYQIRQAAQLKDATPPIQPDGQILPRQPV